MFRFLRSFGNAIIKAMMAGKEFFDTDLSEDAFEKSDLESLKIHKMDRIYKQAKKELKAEGVNDEDVQKLLAKLNQ